MQKYLNIEKLAEYQQALTQKTKDNLLNLFFLGPKLHAQINALDVNTQSLSADIFYDFFNGLLGKNLQIEEVNYKAVIRNSTPISIQAINPILSPADNYVASSPAMLEDGMHFKVSEDLQTTQHNLQQAIDILQDYQESGLQSNLINSIAIYDGQYPIPTSCSTLLCQGRFFALNVGQKYPLFYYLDMLVHEVAHQYLQIINYLEPLSFNDDKKLLSAGNNKLRPIYGIINAAFVLYRLITFYQSAKKLLCSIEEEPGIKEPSAYMQTRFFQIPCNYTLRLEVYKLKLTHTLQQLKKSKSLTEQGLQLLELLTYLG